MIDERYIIRVKDYMTLFPLIVIEVDLWDKL